MDKLPYVDWEHRVELFAEIPEPFTPVPVTKIEAVSLNSKLLNSPKEEAPSVKKKFEVSQSQRGNKHAKNSRR